MLKIKTSDGAGHLFLFLGIVVIGVISLVGWRVLAKNQTESADNSQKATSKSNQNTSSGLLYLKSIGFNIDNYDAATNHAGDMVFNHEDHDLSGNNHLIFADFGTQDYRSPNDLTKRNPQPTFILPLGTKVHSLVDGIVADVKDLYSNDQTIWVTSTGDMSSGYIYETEHIVNPLVKKGDHVKGGQIIGDVSIHDSDHHPGFGIVEIGILHPQGNQATHICPFHYLEPSIKTDIQAKILNVHKAWENYLGMSNLYDAHSAEPGCDSLAPVNG